MNVQFLLDRYVLEDSDRYSTFNLPFTKRVEYSAIVTKEQISFVESLILTNVQKICIFRIHIFFQRSKLLVAVTLTFCFI